MSERDRVGAHWYSHGVRHEGYITRVPMRDEGTSREPRTADEWKAAYFRMMELRDEAQAEVAGLKAQLAAATPSPDDYLHTTLHGVKVKVLLDD